MEQPKQKRLLGQEFVPLRHRPPHAHRIPNGQRIDDAYAETVEHGLPKRQQSRDARILHRENLVLTLNREKFARPLANRLKARLVDLVEFDRSKTMPIATC